MLHRLLLAVAGGGDGFPLDVGDVADFGWTNVKDSGATGDGSTDDTAAINTAIAAVNSAGRGVLYFPPGTYLTTGDLTDIDVPCIVAGAGGGGGETLDYQGGGLTVGHVSQIVSSSGTNVLFTVASSGVQFHDLSLRCSNGSPSAGAAIQTVATGGDHAVYAGLTIVGFYNQIDHQYGREYTIGPHNHFIDPVNDSIKLQNLDAADEGEVTIFDCRFLQQTTAPGNSAINLLRSGGFRVHHCQFYGLGPASTVANVMIRVEFADPSSNIRISDNSMENFLTHAIGINLAGGDQVFTVQIHDNNFNGGQTANHETIYIRNATNVQIHDNTMIGYSQAFAAIGLHTVTGANIHDNGHSDFDSGITSETSCTGITKTGNYTLA